MGHSLTPSNNDNVWALESVCGPIASCDSNSPHYNTLTAGTEQDLVLRGSFKGVDVDTDVNVQTKFEECPLESSTSQLGGILKLGLGMRCAASDGAGGHTNSGAANDGGDGATLTIDSDVTLAGVVQKDCRESLATSKAVINAAIYLDNKNTAGAAAASGWSFKNIDYKINRFETDLTGNKDPAKEISSDLLQEIRLDNTGAGTYECTMKAGGVTGLPNGFDPTILQCAGTSTDSGLTSSGATAAQVSKLEFDLQPLQSANMDVFEIEVIAVLRNAALETRRLRHTYTLRADGSVDESSSGFQVLPASKEISDNDKGGNNEAGETHDMVHGINTVMIIVLSLSGLMVLVLIGVYGPKLYRKCCGRAPEDGLNAEFPAEPNSDGFSEADRLVGSGRSTRFSNLRY